MQQESVWCVTLSTRCIMKIIISLAGPVGNMKQILHSYWLPKQARWANQVFLTMLAMEPQKVVEENQNKGKNQLL